MTETVWITGVTGFTGGHLVNFLNNLPLKPYIIGLGRGSSAPDNINRYYQVDINDTAALKDIARSDPPTKVIHLATAMPPVGDAEMWHVNVGGTVNLVRCLAATGNKDVRLLCIGSAAEYLGPFPDDINESCPSGGETIYGRTKWAQTTLGLSLGEKFGLPVMIARPFNLIGPGLPRKLVAGELCAQFANHNIDTISVGNTKSIRDFIDVRDAVEAYWKIINQSMPFEIYNVCSGKPVSIKELLAIFSRLSRKPKEVIRNKEITRSVDLDMVYGNNDKVRGDTGWYPKISLEKSVNDMLINVYHEIKQN